MNTSNLFAGINQDSSYASQQSAQTQIRRLYQVEFEGGSHEFVVAFSVKGATSPFELSDNRGRIVEVSEVADSVLFGS